MSSFHEDTDSRKSPDHRFTKISKTRLRKENLENILPRSTPVIRLHAIQKSLLLLKCFMYYFKAKHKNH